MGKRLGFVGFLRLPMGFVDYLLLNRQVLLTKAELSEKRLKTRLWVLYSLFQGF